MPATTFHFTEGQFDLLAQLSELENRSKSAQVRQLIIDAAQRVNLKPRVKVEPISDGTTADHAVTYPTIQE